MLKNKILILKKRSYDILTLFFVHIKSHLYLGWLARQFETIEFMVKHSKWVAQNKIQNPILNGFIRGDVKQLHETIFKDEKLVQDVVQFISSTSDRPICMPRNGQHEE